LGGYYDVENLLWRKDTLEPEKQQFRQKVKTAKSRVVAVDMEASRFMNFMKAVSMEFGAESNLYCDRNGHEAEGSAGDYF
jgi:hypothetical protein